eukprot:CAMPEP_0184324130 /NCGR_PEP_ID=MMETSP1049-20130417/133690_1 /TAXON_ID=77928 /ORGANISM="Proteomonas sulcata, Strain CCMP704" /LENGTH=85 /DNA_ID=CAMNT_0026645827 /DNA_START=17 /DNA_END=274 /DNA_ORIENTATION=-
MPELVPDHLLERAKVDSPVLVTLVQVVCRDLEILLGHVHPGPEVQLVQPIAELLELDPVNPVHIKQLEQLLDPLGQIFVSVEGEE